MCDAAAPALPPPPCCAAGHDDELAELGFQIVYTRLQSAAAPATDKETTMTARAA